MESLNSLRPPLIEQAEDGYRYSIEPFLLASFVHLPINCRILDLGTGCGIIPLLLETRGMIKEIVGIEIQNTLYDLAVKNVLRNGVSNKIRLVHGDFISFKPDKKHRIFDVVISNPPYRKLNTGRMNPNYEKAVARHEISMNIEALTAKAYYFLKDGGVFTLTYPPTRLTELLQKLCEQKLFPARIRFIHGSQDTEARIFLIDAIKEQRADYIIEPPLYIYNRDGSYSKEMKKIYASFNYSSGPHYIKEE